MSSSFYLVIIKSTAFATSSELICTSPDLTKSDRKVISFHSGLSARQATTNFLYFEATLETSSVDWTGMAILDCERLFQLEQSLHSHCRPVTHDHLDHFLQWAYTTLIHLHHQWNGSCHRLGWYPEHRQLSQDCLLDAGVPCPQNPAPHPVHWVSLVSLSWESGICTSTYSSSSSPYSEFVERSASVEEQGGCSSWPVLSSVFFLGLGTGLHWAVAPGWLDASGLSRDTHPVGNKWFRCNVCLLLLSGSLWTRYAGTSEFDWASMM